MPRPREFPTFLLALPPEEPPLDLAFTIETMDSEAQLRWRVIGRTSELSVANAIFEAAAREDPALPVVLRQGGVVLRRSP
jgi:hypothetical protein